MDKYKAEDMTGHDITKVQDYASFMAIHANNQGNGSEGALKRFNEIVVKGGRRPVTSCGQRSVAEWSLEITVNFLKV